MGPSEHNARALKEVTRKLTKALSAVQSGFPMLEHLTIYVSHHGDLISGSAVLRFMSPLCCIRRLESIKFVAQDVCDRAQAKNPGKKIEGVGRLRKETAILAAVSSVFARNCDSAPDRIQLHEKGKCVHRIADGGVQLLTDMLAQLLKEKHRVKFPKLM